MTFRTTSVSQHVFLRGFLSVCTLAAGSRMWRGTWSSDVTMGCLDLGCIPSLLKSRLSSQRLWMSVHIGRPTLTLEGSEEPGFRVDAGSCTDTEEDMGQVHTKILLSTMLGKSHHLFLWQKITGMWLTSIVNSLEQSLPDIVQRDFPGTLFKTRVCFNKSGASPSSALFCFSVPGVVPSLCQSRTQVHGYMPSPSFSFSNKLPGVWNAAGLWVTLRRRVAFTVCCEHHQAKHTSVIFRTFLFYF